MDIKEKIRSAPDSPGTYIFKDKNSKIIYIGKAASIRKRLKGHFAKNASSKQAQLIENIKDVEYILTPDESTALLLEAALIGRYKPRYNISLKDDKSYPRLKLTVNEEYPRLFITRKLKDDGALYFGPYTNSKLLRKAVDFMRRVFQLRTCQRMPKKECLDFHIGQCIGPCIDKGKKGQYLKIVQELKLFLEGKQKELLEYFSRQMKEFSDKKDYESAARIRDRIKALSLIAPTDKTQKTPVILKEGPLPIQPSQQIESLRQILGLPRPPHIIEAFDVSNTSGKEAVGSAVCFKDGKPYINRYRHFKIKTVNVIDDYSMMREIVARRYKGLISSGEELPDLVIIDGGKGHLVAAKSQIRAMKLIDIPVISIAKNPDKIYLSEKKEPVLIGKFEGLLVLVQRIRDEAHRFAIDYHRRLRRKKLKASELDDIKGIGPKRKAELIKYFGSLDEIKTADIEDLKKAEFISEKEAKAIYNHFRV